MLNKVDRNSDEKYTRSERAMAKRQRDWPFYKKKRIFGTQETKQQKIQCKARERRGRKRKEIGQAKRNWPILHKTISRICRRGNWPRPEYFIWSFAYSISQSHMEFRCFSFLSLRSRRNQTNQTSREYVLGPYIWMASSGLSLAIWAWAEYKHTNLLFSGKWIGRNISQIVYKRNIPRLPVGVFSVPFSVHFFPMSVVLSPIFCWKCEKEHSFVLKTTKKTAPSYYESRVYIVQQAHQ